MHLLKSSDDLRNKLISVLLFLVVSAMVAGVAQYVAQGFRAISIPFPTSRPEAFVLDGIMRLAAGDALYRLLADAPMTVHVYNVFAYVAPAVVASPFSNNAETLLVAGRCIGFASSIALALLLGLYAFRISSSYLVALFTALLPFFFTKSRLHNFSVFAPSLPLYFLALRQSFISCVPESARQACFVWLAFASFRSCLSNPSSLRPLQSVCIS